MNPDYAHLQTEKELAKLEKRIASIYKETRDELDETVKTYFESFEKRDSEMKKLIGTIQNGKEWTEADYKQWRLNQIGRGERFDALRDEMAHRYTDANEVAVAYVNDATPGIYSMNRNYSAYTIDKATGGALTMPNGKLDASWTLFDESTVRRLVVEKPGLMPNYPAEKALNRGIDLAYGKKQITSTVTSAILQGKSIKGIADDLQSRIPDMNRASAIRTARTSITGAQNGGRQDAYQSAVKMGIKMKKQWLATLDSRTRHSHARLDGEIIEVGGKYSNGCRYPGDPHGKPHEVYNCFVGETNIASDSEIVRSYKHKYSGDLIEVKTSSGVNFTCTPNHPILTPRGWVNAALLNNGDDLLIASIGNSVDSRRNPYINHIHPRMDAFHEFFNVILGKRTSALGVNFHGDIATSEVEVITHKRFLRGHRDSGICKSIYKFLLKIANESFVSNRPAMKHLWGICKTSFSFVRCACKPFSFLRGSLSHAIVHRFRTVSDFDSLMPESAIDDLATAPVFLGKFLDGFSGKIFTDNIIGINRVVAVDCHVYNLQTESGLYFVNNIISQDKEKCNGNFAIAHNCRCTEIAVLDDVDTSDAQRRARDPETGESVLISDMTYQEWAGWKKKETVAKSVGNDTIKRKTNEVGTVQTIGKINVNKFRVVSDGIRTDEVVITDERIEHIRQRHPNDYERYAKYIGDMLVNPQYILEDSTPNTAVVLQEFEEAGERFRLILRLAVQEDAEYKKNSVITFLKISEKKFGKYLRNKKILYKSE